MVSTASITKERTVYKVAHGFDYESLYLGFKKVQAIDFDKFKIITYVSKDPIIDSTSKNYMML